MGARPVFNPDKPGASNAERSIAQAMQIKRGKEELAQQKPTLALTYLRQALAKLPGSPRNAEIHFLMGRAYDMAEQPQQAMVAYEKGVAVEPSNPVGHYLLARSYKAAKRLAQAFTSIQRAVSLAPRVLVYRFDRVTIELDLGKKQEGEQSYRAYEKLRNDYIAQLKGGQDKKRLAAVNALASVPTDPVNIRTLRFTLGDKSPALRTAVALLVLGAVSFPEWRTVPQAGTRALVYMVVGGGVVAGSVGMLSFYAAIRGAPLSRVMPIAFTAPLFGALMGMALGGEPLTLKTVVGTLLTVGGIALLTLG